jgi:hypothetical protein
LIQWVRGMGRRLTDAFHPDIYLAICSPRTSGKRETKMLSESDTFLNNHDWVGSLKVD